MSDVTFTRFLRYLIIQIKFQTSITWYIYYYLINRRHSFWLGSRGFLLEMKKFLFSCHFQAFVSCYISFFSVKSLFNFSSSSMGYKMFLRSSSLINLLFQNLSYLSTVYKAMFSPTSLKLNSLLLVILIFLIHSK